MDGATRRAAGVGGRGKNGRTSGEREERVE